MLYFAIDNEPDPGHKMNQAIETTADRVRRVLSGSATPAMDLLVMVDDGEMTAHEATQALKRTGRKVADVHSAAAFELDHMRRLDC